MSGGYEVKKLDPSTQTWSRQTSQGAVKIALSPRGNPAIITDKGELILKQSNSWKTMKGCTKAVAFANENTLYRLDCEKNNYGYRIFKITAQTGWEELTYAGAVAITVDGKGEPWVINQNNYIFKWDSKKNIWAAD